VLEVKEVLASYGAIAEEADSTPWEEVYPDFNASVALRGARKREGLTQKELAALIGASQTHISEMEHGKRPIGKDLAKRLAKVLKADYRVFL
jgi:ribosome-binding protein aMBF1 (putative translation factor)